ncbi:DinB family protein [Ferruginibacter sp. SUN106]|uniref:DinB family protein n=1 Tax=Ferruginibacter sp. SUN106 TaxID=2978348 RepID=UPI003D36A593
MSTIEQLIHDVAIARNEFIDCIKNINEQQAAFKSSPDEWSIIDNTEHLFWAEQGAIFGMWKILYAIRDGKSERTFESDHKEWPIEKLIEQTWKEKEIVPPMAAPRLGGTLIFWRLSLAGLQPLLENFGKDLQEDELRLQAHPHPISGAMDFQQRLEFLHFHILRHLGQVQSTIVKIKQKA